MTNSELIKKMRVKLNSFAEKDTWWHLVYDTENEMDYYFNTMDSRNILKIWKRKHNISFSGGEWTRCNDINTLSSTEYINKFYDIVMAIKRKTVLNRPYSSTNPEVTSDIYYISEDQDCWED